MYYFSNGDCQSDLNRCMEINSFIFKRKETTNKKTVFDIEKLAIKLNKAVSEQKTLYSLFKIR